MSARCSVISQRASFRGGQPCASEEAGPIPAYELATNGHVIRSIPAGVEGVVAVKDLQIGQAGTYRFTARSADGRIAGESNPIWAEDNPTDRVYWGETHGHSGMAEGMGSIDGFYRWGRDDARLDFLGLTEHDLWLDDAEWLKMQDAVRRYTVPGRYIAFLAYEWTADRFAGGHHNDQSHSRGGSGSNCRLRGNGGDAMGNRGGPSSWRYRSWGRRIAWVGLYHNASPSPTET